MNREDILSRLRLVQVQLVINGKRAEGVKGLYDAACYADDGQLAQSYRDQYHALVDEGLDLSAQATALARQLMQCSD